MCSGKTTKYSCGHENLKYYYKCADGRNPNYPLPHRVLGRTFRIRRLCDNCEQMHRLEIRIDARRTQQSEERAKALMEYFRGERRWPVTDSGLEDHLRMLYDRGDRLHPWPSGDEIQDPTIEFGREMMEADFQDTTTIDATSPNKGLRLWQEMLDRQTEIDRTRRPIRPDDRMFSCSELLARAQEHREAIRERMRARFREGLAELQQRGHTRRREELDQGEFLGLYESDPEWLLNFDDWCEENFDRDRPPTETDVLRDIDGWFRHLHSCESQVRREWMATAETFRDGYILHNWDEFDYVPEPRDEGPSTFKCWRFFEHSTEPTEVATYSIFLEDLHGYENYLVQNEWHDDLQAYQLRRRRNIEKMSAGLSKIPGAPLSRSSATGEIELYDTPSLILVCSSTPDPGIEGTRWCGDYVRNTHLHALLRFRRLTEEAYNFRAGLITEYRIEREEFLGIEQEDTDNFEGSGGSHNGGRRLRTSWLVV